MKRILATTAIVALTASSAFAASHAAEDETKEPAAESAMEHSDAAMDPMAEINGMIVNASDLMGQRVYVRGSAEAEIGDTAAEPDADWEDIGEVGDVVVTQEGDIQAIVLDVGGFLGIGEKEVSTTMDELKFVQEEGSEDAYFIVYTGDRAALEEREIVDRDMTRDEGSSFYSERADAGMSDAEMDDSAAMEDAEMAEEDTAAKGDEPMDGDVAETDTAESEPTVAMTEEADMGDEMGYAGLTASGLIGLSVYDGNDERIGEISELLVSDEGQITEVIVDVGGFLGIGEKPVALPFENLTMAQDEAGATRAGTAYTLEELEGLETWEG